MGANLSLTAVVMKETKSECLKRINKLDWSDVEYMFDRFENVGVLLQGEPGATDKALVGVMKERLKEAVEIVYDSYGNRDVDTINVYGIGSLHITGGATWGDDPTEEFIEFNLFNEFVGYPYWNSPKSIECKEWHKIGRKRAKK